MDTFTVRLGGPWDEHATVAMKEYLAESGTPVIIETTGGQTIQIPAGETVNVYVKPL